MTRVTLAAIIITVALVHLDRGLHARQKEDFASLEKGRRLR